MPNIPTISDPFALGAPFPDFASAFQRLNDFVTSRQQGGIMTPGGFNETPTQQPVVPQQAAAPVRTQQARGLRYGSTAAEHNANARMIAELTRQQWGLGATNARATVPAPRVNPTGNNDAALSLIQNNGFATPPRRTGGASSQAARGTPMSTPATATPQVNPPSVFDVFTGGNQINSNPGVFNAFTGGASITSGKSPIFNATRGRF